MRKKKERERDREREWRRQRERERETKVIRVIITRIDKKWLENVEKRCIVNNFAFNSFIPKPYFHPFIQMEEAFFFTLDAPQTSQDAFCGLNHRQ